MPLPLFRSASKATDERVEFFFKQGLTLRASIEDLQNAIQATANNVAKNVPGYTAQDLIAELERRYANQERKEQPERQEVAPKILVSPTILLDGRVHIWPPLDVEPPVYSVADVNYAMNYDGDVQGPFPLDEIALIAEIIHDEPGVMWVYHLQEEAEEALERELRSHYPDFRFERRDSGQMAARYSL